MTHVVSKDGTRIAYERSGLGVDKVIAYEPPYVDESMTNTAAFTLAPTADAHEQQLKELVATGNRGGAAIDRLCSS